MTFRICLALFATLAAGRWMPTLHAQGATAATTVDPAALPPELAALLAPPAWSFSASANAGFGYKDNVLLSHANEERSAFARGGFDAMLWRMPPQPAEGSDFVFFAGGEGTRYFTSATVDHEDQAFMRGEWRFQKTDAFRLGLSARGYYDDEVFDVSDTDVRRLVAELKVRGATFGPTVHWEFLPSLWVEAEAEGKRARDRDGVLDNHTADGTVRLGWHRGDRVEISVAGIERFCRYDSRSQFSAVGRELPDTHLKVREREGEARFVASWNKAWKTTTRAGVLRYSDNGPGFFNYRQRGVAQEIEWERGAWSVDVEGAARRLEYTVQTVGFGFAPQALVKDEFSADAKVTRKLSARWSLFAQYSWERRRSNDEILSYNVNEGLLGARWSWEK